MARQRIRADQTWLLACQKRKALVEKLASLAISNAGATVRYNDQGHWQDVGRYNLLNEILWDCDK